MSSWLKNPQQRLRRASTLLLLLSIVWAVFRISRSMRELFATSHDLYTYYTIWYVLLHREFAELALRGALYLPHTWLFMTPVLMFGWRGAQIIMLLLNIGAVTYIWIRLRQLAELRDIRGTLLLTFFCGWLSTGIVVALGNLALVCVALMLAAFPFATRTNAMYLAFSAMKQTLVFPVYLRLLIQRPRMYIIPILIFGICGVVALVWARLTPLEFVSMARESVQAVSGWTQADHTCLRRLISPFLDHPRILSAINWLAWFALFGLVVKFIRDPLAQLAAFLLLSLLPIYHNIYDLVAAAPALAVFLQRAPLWWSALMSACLYTNPFEQLAPHVHFATLQQILGYLRYAYYPIVILTILGGLFYLECARRQSSARPAAASGRGSST